MDGIILLCFLFVCVGNSLTVFQANTNFTCILALFSWNTETIPSSVRELEVGWRDHQFTGTERGHVGEVEEE